MQPSTLNRKVGVFVALKIDLEKSYERVSWDNLRVTLHDFGFPPSVVNLIMWRVQLASISILWNGSKLPSFTSQQGLCQCDTLSPYCFVLCMETLAIQAQKLVNDEVWHPICITKEAIGIFHLFFCRGCLVILPSQQESNAISGQDLT